MASAVTLQSTTLEGQLVEIIELMQILELDPDANPNNENRITGNNSLDNASVNGTFNIAFTTIIDAQGRPVREAVEYLSDPGQGGN